LETSKWLPTTQEQRLVWAIRIAVVLGVLVAISYEFDKTLWDWLKLLIVPAVIAAGAAWFNQQQRKRELEIADSRAQDEALQAYLGEMSELLLEKKVRKSGADSEERSLARAQTLTTLTRVGPERKGSVVRFLYEIGLISMDSSIIASSRANLKGADLRGGTCSGQT
jgi:hypothetical protein